MNGEIKVTGRIHSYESFGAVDGPGIRFVVFMQGCLLRCLYCHNPDSWDCSGGEQIGAQQLLQKILACKSFIKKGGVTFSGGEPLLQADFVAHMTALLQQHGLHVAIDTSGAVPLQRCKTAVDAADLLLLDIKALDPELCVTLTGRDNRQALQMLDFRQQQNKPVWIRHVVVPGYTLDVDRLQQLAAFLKSYSCIERVELLPFHKMGEYKWKQLRLPYTLEAVQPPQEPDLRRAKELFRSYGLPVDDLPA